MKTIVGLYKSVDEANKVKSALGSEGFSADKITVIDQSPDSYSTGYEQERPEDGTVGGKIKHFFSSLSGSDDAAHESYHQGVSQGGALLAVKAEDGRAEEVADLLHQHGATEIEGGYGDSTYAGGNSKNDLAGTRDYEGKTPTDAQVIPIVEEELLVGKRSVERGGVRIYSHMVEKPVSESISLHDERVVMERRAVDRPATEADFATGTRAVEVRAMGEEAVVGKTSRVVEEVLVGKQASDRTEEISDTVRHTEVDVEPTEVATSTTGKGMGTGRL